MGGTFAGDENPVPPPTKYPRPLEWFTAPPEEKALTQDEFDAQFK
jgi:hypothetical protein